MQYHPVVQYRKVCGFLTYIYVPLMSYRQFTVPPPLSILQMDDMASSLILTVPSSPHSVPTMDDVLEMAVRRL